MSVSETKTGLNPSSAVRYRFQSLLLIMAIVAAVAALCGAYFRGSGVAEQRCLLTLWGSGFASSVIWMLAYAWGRQRAEKKVGEVNFRLPWSLCMRSWIFSPNRYGIFSLLFAALLMILATSSCADFAGRGRPLGVMAALGHNSGLLLALGLISIWWRKEFWLGENGIAWLAGFRPWGKLKHAHPHKKQAETLVLEIEYGVLIRKVAIRVPSELREQVDALLDEKLQASTISSSI